MSKEAKILLFIGGLFTLALGLSNVFVSVFLWKKSNDFVTIAQYNLMSYLFLPLSFTAAGWLSKRKNGVWALRIGIIFFVLFFLFILLVQDQVIHYIYPLGSLFGIASGFYWLSFNVLSFDFTSTNNRDSFNGFKGFMAGISNAVAPFSGAYIIEKNNTKGYFIVFLISLSIFVVLILVSLLLRSEHYGEKLNYKKIISNNGFEWKHLRKSTIAWGLRDVVILFLIHILIYKTTGSEIALGKLLLISYFISSAAFILEQKLISPNRRFFSLHIGAVFMLISVLGLVMNINYTFLLVYMILSGAFVPFFFVPFSSATFNVLNRNHEENMRIEYIINKEIALNIGRVISTSILILLLTYVQNKRVLNYFLLFIGSAQIISLYFLRKLKTWEL